LWAFIRVFDINRLILIICCEFKIFHIGNTSEFASRMATVGISVLIASSHSHDAFHVIKLIILFLVQMSYVFLIFTSKGVARHLSILTLVSWRGFFLIWICDLNHFVWWMIAIKFTQVELKFRSISAWNFIIVRLNVGCLSDTCNWSAVHHEHEAVDGWAFVDAH